MNTNKFTEDLLVVDFTEYHRLHPTECLPSYGVSFLKAPDDRIGAFCILNPNRYLFEAINLEDNPGLMQNNNGELSKQCECICKSYRENGKRWILLLELKYCSEDNIPSNMLNALDKLEQCYDFLNNEKQYFSDAEYRVYLCASHPEHKTVAPFNRFIYNQSRLLELNDKNLTLIYSNAVKILTPDRLMECKVPRKYQYSNASA